MLLLHLAYLLLPTSLLSPIKTNRIIRNTLNIKMYMKRHHVPMNMIFIQHHSNMASLLPPGRRQGEGETLVYGHSPGREAGLGHVGDRATQEQLPRRTG